MATKQGKVVKSAVTRERNRGVMREEKHMLWFLLAIILLLLYLLFAQYKGWWPYSPPKLGTAFYTNLSAQTATGKSDKAGSGDTNNSTNSGNTNTGGTTNNGSPTPMPTPNPTPNPTPTPTPTPTPPAPTPNPIAKLAAGIDVGDTKANVSSQANGLNEHCAVIVNADAQTIGKQEVCTYSEGDKLVTVTYLNDRVISASKSGF